MFTEKDKTVSLGDIESMENLTQRVQVLIETCLTHHMSQNEAVEILWLHENIQPIVTKIVWQKLEVDNQDFFRAYNLRLMVKDQIVQFNSLLEKQHELMFQLLSAERGASSVSNGALVQPFAVNRDSVYYAPSRLGSIVSTSLPNTFYDGDALPNILLGQNPNVGIMQGVDGQTIGGHDCHAGNLHLPTTMPDTSLSSFHGAEFNHGVVDANGSSIRSYGEISRDSSLLNFIGDDFMFDKIFESDFGQEGFGSD